MSAFPSCPFWDFSLALYARPGVAEACLRLQARHGADVNLLFFAAWTAAQGRRLDDDDVAALRARVAALHDQVVRPLRAARTSLKRMVPEADAALAPMLGALRAAIKRSELDAEQAEQILLASAALPDRAVLPGSAREAAAAANLDVYLAALGAVASAADQADLALIGAAAISLKP